MKRYNLKRRPTRLPYLGEDVVGEYVKFEDVKFSVQELFAELNDRRVCLNSLTDYTEKAHYSAKVEELDKILCLIKKLLVDLERD